MIQSDADRMITAITNALRAEIAVIAEEEIVIAQAKIAHRMREKLNETALSLLSHYEIYSHEQKIIISVRAKALDPESEPRGA